MHMQAKILAQRRQELITRCAQQRASFVAQRHNLKRVFSVADAGVSLVARIRENLGLIVGAAVVLTVIRPRRLNLAPLVQAAGLALRTWRIVTPVLRGIAMRRG